MKALDENLLNSDCIPVKAVIMIIISLLIIILCPSKKQREKKRIKKEVEKRLRLVLIYFVSEAKNFYPDRLNLNDHLGPPELRNINAC